MMNLLRAKWQLFADKVNGLSARERLILGGAVAVLLLGIFDQLLLRPWLQERTDLAQKKVVLQRENATAGNAITELEKQLANDPNQILRDKIAALNLRHQQVDGDIAKITDGMIAPEKMPRLLGQLLSERSGLKVQSIKTLPAEMILSADKNNPHAPAIYRHNLQLRLKGTFAQVQAYLQSVEALPERMVWDHMTFSVAQYPGGELELALHTLSAQEELIRVAQ